MRLITAFFAISFVLCASGCAEAPFATSDAALTRTGYAGNVGATNTTKITFVLISDIYKMEEEKGRGGMARIAAVLKAEKAHHRNVLIVHAGDTLSPSLMSSFDQGAHIVDLFNMMPLDVFVPGNHEFDFGRDVFLKRMGELKAHVIAANLRDGNGNPIAGIEDSKLVDLGGIKIGVIGLTADDSAVTSKPGHLRFSQTLATAESETVRLRKAGAELIVLVPHAGRHIDERLFDSGIADVILSGHDHDLYMRFNEKTAIAEAGADGMAVVAVDLTINAETKSDGARKVRWWPRFRFIDTADIAPDPEVASRVAQYSATLEDEVGEPIGRTLSELDSRNATVRGGEAAIGNLFADALRDATKADVALTNGGGFRGGKVYPAGTALSRKDVLTEFPFGNKAYVLAVTGKTLRASLEAGFAGAENEVGRFPQVSGMRVKADLTRPDGKRVVSVLVGGKPLDDARTYKLVTSDYLANGGDGYTPLKSTKIVVGETESELVTNIVIAHIKAKGSVAPSIDGRVVVARARASR